MNKKKIIGDTGIDVFMQAVQSTVQNYGSHLLEAGGADVVRQMIGDVAIETGASVIPIVGQAISSYKVNKKISNLEKFINLVATRLDFFIERLNNSKLDDREKYSELLDFAYDSVGSYGQKEKIQFLVNGLETIVNTDKISFDIAYLYINTLNRLSLLDISVIKLYSPPSRYFNNDQENENAEFKTYQDVLDKFNITMEQYNAVRSNLNILGLLEKKTDQTLEKDLSELEDHIKRIDSNVKLIHSDLELIMNPKKKISKLKKIKVQKIKINADDKFVVSKFGKDFYKYFLNKD